jgi:hypothetical protein
MKTRLRASRLAVGAALMVGLLGGWVASFVTASSAAPSPMTAANGTTYVARVPCCQTIVLGPQSSPTRVLTSKVIRPGTYAIVSHVDVVMGQAHSGGQEGAVCGTGTTMKGDIGLTPFGTTGNGSATSGTGPDGTYGNAVMNGVIVVNHASDHLEITCNSTLGGRGTYVSSALVMATKIPSVVDRST